VVNTAGVISAEGRLVPVRSSTLSFLSGGELGELLVREGDSVDAGAVLARLGKREPLQAALSQANLELLSAQQALNDLTDTQGVSREQRAQALVDARAALNEAQNALEDLDTDDFQNRLDDATIKVQDNQEKMDDAKEELDKYLDLDTDNTTRKNAQTTFDNAERDYNNAVYDRDALQYELDQANAKVDLASAQVDDALRQFDAWKDGVDADQQALAEARVKMAEDQVAAAQRALDNADLTAPYAGTVVDLFDLQVGERVGVGQSVATLADFSAWIVETRDLTELDVVGVEIGQPVTVTPDALPELRLTGVVESIDQVFTERSGDILYTVRIRLDDTDPRLRWGMTVNAVFGD
jgi:multidrug efflux pump subunit AcrA (membrane-fusion protein)